MRVAFIGNIHSKCGIATYNEQLFSALEGLCDIHFFAEKNGNPDSDNIKYCWEREEFPKSNLIDLIDQYKPDIILFSHEYGIFPKSYFFSTLVSYFKLRGYKVVTIFHSVYENHKDKLTTESVCKNVVVHTEESKETLIKKGIDSRNLNVVPHGCSFGTGDESILPNLWNHFGNEHIVLQAGFLFYYKSHLEMLDVIFDLKKKYKDILYVILASENPKCQKEHDKLYGDIVKKIQDLDLFHNVIIDRGFASFDVMMSYIRTTSVVVLPYKPSPEFDVFAASGMARVVLQTSTPLITSFANLFNGLDEVVKKASTREEWVLEIENVFDKKVNKKEIISSRKKFIQENSWKNAAKKLVEVFKNAK